MDKRIFQLDGIRGIAALMVLVAHYFGETASGLTSLQFGWFGVEIFFVLSGFLIGGIIFDEMGKAGFWRSFYVRRTARIVPLYLATVAFVMVLGAEVSPLAYLTFTHNFVFAAQGMDAIYTHPLWTIAVEEQFYLVLPLILMATPKRWVLAVLLTIIAAAPAFRLVMFALDQASASSVLLFGRMDLLGAGVLAAWGLRNLDLRRHLTLLRVAPIPLLIGASAMNSWLGYDAFVVFGQGLIALGVAAFITSIALGAPEFKGVLSGKMLGFFGTISYGVYLLHQPINTLVHRTVLGTPADVGTPIQIALTLSSVAITVLAAWGSWMLMERHILTAARRWLASNPPKAGMVGAVA